MPALLRLVRGLLLHGLRLPDVQPRRMCLRRMLGLLRELHLRRLHLPHLLSRRLIPTTPAGYRRSRRAHRGVGTAPDRRLGVLVDHLVEGSKESRIVNDLKVLVTGHPYVRG
jgi:hypothetical protein